MAGIWRAAAALVVMLGLGLSAAAQDSPPPEAGPASDFSTEGEEPPQPAPEPAEPEEPVRDPNIGSVTTLPLPRYVSLKTSEGNARRGPGLSHRIDWVFKRAGMPLRVTAEYENWRRVQDAEGAGGWVHYTLLSGVRSALVVAQMADLHSDPESGSPVVLHAEQGVIARIAECSKDWCRLNTEAGRGWVTKNALWGVDPEEVID